MVGDVLRIGNGAKRRPHAFGVDDVLDRKRNAFQHTPFAGNNPAFRLFGLRQSLLATERDEAIQLGL